MIARKTKPQYSGSQHSGTEERPRPRRFGSFGPNSIRLDIAHLIYVVTLISTIFLVYLIDQRSTQILVRELDAVYRKNQQIEQLIQTREAQERHLVTYLGTRNSRSLEDYYLATDRFRAQVQELKSNQDHDEIAEIEDMIVLLTPSYLKHSDDSVQAKRGRNAALYREHYEAAAAEGETIDHFLSLLNDRVFRQNSQSAARLSEAIRLLDRNTIMIILIAAAISLLLSYLMTRSVTEPIRSLTSAAKTLAAGDEHAKVPVFESIEELKNVSLAFNTMVDDLRTTKEARLTEARQAEEARENARLMRNRLTDAQLKYLQAQIDPHFLYNILNAGVQLALLEDAPKTSTYLLHTARFFRHNLRAREETSAIAQELELVDHYIYIMNVRFGGQISYTKALEVPHEMLEVEMPTMILQPIVENALVHAFAAEELRPEITVRLFTEDEELRLSITDNGSGMSDETIRAIFTRADDKHPSITQGGGVGLDNVISRLRLYRKQRDILQIESTLGEGTCVTLILRSPGDEPFSNFFDESPAEAFSESIESSTDESSIRTFDGLTDSLSKTAANENTDNYSDEFTAELIAEPTVELIAEPTDELTAELIAEPTSEPTSELRKRSLDRLNDSTTRDYPEQAANGEPRSDERNLP